MNVIKAQITRHWSRPVRVSWSKNMVSWFGLTNSYLNEREQFSIFGFCIQIRIRYLIVFLVSLAFIYGRLS